jgi:hypothetical protein
MSMENKMTPEEEEFALAEATKAQPYTGICIICKNPCEAQYQFCSKICADIGRKEQY